MTAASRLFRTNAEEIVRFSVSRTDTFCHGRVSQFRSGTAHAVAHFFGLHSTLQQSWFALSSLRPTLLDLFPQRTTCLRRLRGISKSAFK
jgi:hypothetical protein